MFSTKQRAKLIQNNLQERLWQYLTGIRHNLDLILVAVGGIEDHIHMLFHLPPTRALADVMRVLKTNSSVWMNDHKKGFAWQEGYGAFAVSASNLEKVMRYIHNQEMHHRKTSFEEEYLGLLRKHGVDFDPSVRIRLVPPLPGLVFSCHLPTANAVGYNMSPLPGLRR